MSRESENTSKLSITDIHNKMVYEILDYAVLLLDKEGNVQNWNAGAERIKGYSPKEILGKNFRVFYTDKDLQNDLPQRLLRIAAGAGHAEDEGWRVKKDGTTFWANVSITALHDNTGQIIGFTKITRDLTQRKSAEESLKQLNSELKAIFNAGIKVSIIGTDINGLITLFSAGSENLLGYSCEEMVLKQYITSIFRKEEIFKHSRRYSTGQDPLPDEELWASFAGRESNDTREWMYVRKDGSSFQAQVALTSIKADNGEVRGFLAIAHDLTDSKMAEENRRKYAEIEARNKELEQFTHIASHDLQEPLKTITGFAQRLASRYFGKQLDDEGNLYLSYMLASAGRMRELIEGLLHYSRIGREFQLKETDCNQLLLFVLADINSSISQSNAHISIGILPTINAHPSELRQLFQNLLTNALKFKKAGVDPVISVSSIQTASGWQFCVKDNGIGIQSEDQERIFLLFQRLHDREKYEGTGIGLAHCKKIVELHHGKIWVDSVPGEGCSFNFTINTPHGINH